MIAQALRRITGLGAALMAVVLTLSMVEPAQALPDAKVDQQIRPNFGALVAPPTRPKSRHRGPRGPGPIGPPILMTDIDCARAWPGQISDTIARGWDGMTITLYTTNGRGCQEAVVVNRPAQIVGGWDYAPRFATPLLVAPAGRPCISLSPNIWFKLENINIDQNEGEGAPCIQGQNNTVTVVNSGIAYAGSDGAITLAGESRLTILDSQIVSRSQGPAVSMRGRLKVQRSTIGAAVVGLRATPTNDASILGLRLVRLDDWTGSRRSAASAGLVLNDIGDSQLIESRGLEVTGFSRGVYVSGAGEISFLRPTVSQADWAMLVEGPTTRIAQGDLAAQEVGVYAAAGTTFISGTKIRGVMRSGIFAERGAKVRSVDNTVFAAQQGCAALKSGYFDGALTCRPWFEAPELGGKTEVPLPTFEGLQAQLDKIADANSPRPVAGSAPPPGPPPSGTRAPAAGPLAPSSQGPAQEGRSK